MHSREPDWLRDDPQLLIFKSRVLGRWRYAGRLRKCRSRSPRGHQQRDSRGLIDTESVSQLSQRGGVGAASHTPLQISNTATAEAGPFGEFLLAESRCSAVTLQQCCQRLWWVDRRYSHG
jgi:hypothetical protein